MREIEEKVKVINDATGSTQIMEFAQKFNGDNEDIEDENPITTNGSKTIDEAINDSLLEKLKISAYKPQDSTESIRSIAAKLHARVTSSDRRIRERTLEKLWRKNSNAIETFVKILEEMFISGNNSRMAISQLINLGGTQVLIRLMTALQHRETIITEVLAQEILWILGQVAQKDQKFSTKAKILNSVKVFHSLLKANYNNGRTLLPILLIIKTLAKNPSSLQILVKDGIVPTLEKSFVCLGYTPHLKLRTLMECLKYFTVSRLCCTKFVKIGMTNLLMRLFERWERFDGQIRLKICNYCLNTLQHLCVIKSGRKSIKSNGGLQLLYRFCTNCPEEKSYDNLLSRVCGIINHCIEKKELPVPEMSPVRFALPESSGRSVINSVESGSEAPSIGMRLESDGESCDDEESENSGGKRIETGGEDSEEKKFFSGVVTSLRSEEELLSYNRFFGELVSPPKKSSNQKRLEVGIEGLKTLSEVSDEVSEHHAYCIIASTVRSVISFSKVAYPDLVGGDGPGIPAPLNSKDRKVCRSKLLSCVERGLHPGAIQHETSYDLDQLAGDFTPREEDKILCNRDEEIIGKRCKGDSNQLVFESRFESGNLRKAVQIAPREYDLILTPDVNSVSRHQWFYFEVSNMDGGQTYTFNIINCEKANSQFNFGMKPVIYSVRESLLGNSGWVRTGKDICYYRNCYQRPGKEKNYLTTSFAIVFPHSNDVCYLAYHFPYTYSRLMADILKWSRQMIDGRVYFRAENLCNTLNGNESPLLTITAPESRSNPIQNRKIVFLTSRVHPGESNASWVMHGTLEALLANSTYANSLRDDYIFKVVPMLNIEGVVNGCNRYGLTNEDLNRRWSNPNEILHPVIFHAKGLMEYCTRVLRKPPHVFVDYHGHSRRKNVFLFGCSRSGSWSAADRSALPDEPAEYLMLPHLMQKTSPAFALPLCSFKVLRNKESTARVAVWRQLGVPRSYTMESSFCGCDQGSLAGLHLDTKHLKDVGHDFCKALSMMKDYNAGDEFTVEKIAAAEGDDNDVDDDDEEAGIEDETTSSSVSDESEFED